MPNKNKNLKKNKSNNDFNIIESFSNINENANKKDMFYEEEEIKREILQRKINDTVTH